MKALYRFFRTILVITILIITSNRTLHVSAEENQDDKFVLIINSYHQEMSWSAAEAQGMIDSLYDSGIHISYSIEYMDWKSYPYNGNLDYLYQYYKYKYQNKKIDLILTSDDAALLFALKNRTELFSDAPVVFTGVNQEGARLITKGYNNVTGVIEEIDPTDTLELALHVNPNIKNIYLIYDNTESGLSSGRLVIDRTSTLYPDINVISMNQMTYDEIIDTVKNLKQDSVVLMTTYSSDGNNKIMDINYAIRDLCKSSSVPVYHLFDFDLITLQPAE